MTGSGNVVSINDKRDEAKRWPCDVFGWKSKNRLPYDVALSDMAETTGSIADIDWDLTILWNRRYAEAARNWAIYASRDLDDYFSSRPTPLVFRDVIDRLPRTQLRAVEHLQETVAHILRSVADVARNPWMFYDPASGVWTPEGQWLPGQVGSSVNLAVASVIRSFLDALNRSIDLLYTMVDWVVPPIDKPEKNASDDEKQDYADHEAKRNELRKRIKEAHKFAQAIPNGVFTKIESELRKRLAINQEQWDSDTRYLILKDGVIDLKETYRTGEIVLEEFSPLHFSTMRLDIAWNDQTRNAGLSEWERGVKKILPDPDVRGYLQKRYGAALLGTPAIAGKSMVWQYGPGDTAKSTIQECIAGDRGVFSPYALATSSQALLVSRGGGKNDNGERFVAYARGKRFAIMDEIQDGEMLDAEIVKRITGGGTVEGKALYSNAVRYFFTATIFISSNHPPTFPPGDTALQNRIHVIPFKHRFWVQSKNPKEWEASAPEDRADESWATRVLDSPHERSAILRWVIEGLVAFGRDGGIGSLPEAMRDEHDDFIADADPIATLANTLLGEEPGTESNPWLQIYSDAEWEQMGRQEYECISRDRLYELISLRAEQLGIGLDKNGQVSKKTVQRTRSMLSERGGNWKRVSVPGSTNKAYGMSRMLEAATVPSTTAKNKWGL